jgi:hypothetical protein
LNHGIFPTGYVLDAELYGRMGFGRLYGTKKLFRGLSQEFSICNAERIDDVDFIQTDDGETLVIATYSNHSSKLGKPQVLGISMVREQINKHPNHYQQMLAKACELRPAD